MEIDQSPEDIINESYKLIKENTVESAALGQPKADQIVDPGNPGFSSDSIYAPKDNRNPNPKKKKGKKKVKIKIIKRRLTSEAHRSEENLPTHGHKYETPEEAAARIARRKEVNGDVNVKPKELSENDEAYLEEIMGPMEITGSSSLTEQIASSLNKLLVDWEGNREMEDKVNTFRKYKTIINWIVQDSNLHGANKNKIREILVNSSTPWHLHEALVNLKVGSRGHDYKTRNRKY